MVKRIKPYRTIRRRLRKLTRRQKNKRKNSRYSKKNKNKKLTRRRRQTGGVEDENQPTASETIAKFEKVNPEEGSIETKPFEFPAAEKPKTGVEETTTELMGEKNNGSVCTKEKPICLNRSRGQIMEFQCDTANTKYSPEQGLNHLLEYIKSSEPKPDEKDAMAENMTCYSLEMAWLIIVKDIIKRLGEAIDKRKQIIQDEIKQPSQPVNPIEAINTNITSEEIITNENKNLEATINNEFAIYEAMKREDNINIPSFNLKLLFEKMIEYVRVKWELSTFTDEELKQQFDSYEDIKPKFENKDINDQIAFILLNKMKNLIENGGFKTFSELMANPLSTKEIIEKNVKPNKEKSDLELILSILRAIQKIFETTLIFMNEKTDLTNKYPGGNIDSIYTEITKDFTTITSDLEVYNSSTTMEGGIKSFSHYFWKVIDGGIMGVFMSVYVPCALFRFVVLGGWAQQLYQVKELRHYFREEKDYIVYDLGAFSCKTETKDSINTYYKYAHFYSNGSEVFQILPPDRLIRNDQIFIRGYIDNKSSFSEGIKGTDTYKTYKTTRNDKNEIITALMKTSYYFNNNLYDERTAIYYFSNVVIYNPLHDKKRKDYVCDPETIIYRTLE